LTIVFGEVVIIHDTEMKRTMFMGLILGIVTTIAMITATAITTGIAQAQETGCPHPGQCTCNAATGVMTDHAMPPPFNRINNGCTSDS
jgi:hypothetical protein